jgi:beta-lactamase regulating signal transducer with metallopeptidase domain
MTTFHVAGEPATILAQIILAAVRTTVLAIIAALLLKFLRVKSTSACLLAWKIVLYVGLIMPVLGWFLPPLSVPIPYVFAPAPASTGSLAQHESAAFSAFTLHKFATNTQPETSNRSGSPSGGGRLPTDDAHPNNRRTNLLATLTGWAPIAAGVYATVAIFFVSILLVGLELARRLVRSSKPINDSRVTDRLRSVAHTVRSPCVPAAYESSLVAVPITAGVFTPPILLPSTWREWDNAKLDAVLTHEMSHVARRDSLAQFASLLHRAIFWFSPLAWWLNRYLSELAEEASDEAALSAGAERKEYARNVLTFFEALQAAPGRVRWQGVSIAAAGHAEKRLGKILSWRGANTVGLKKSEVLMIVAVAAAMTLLTAATRPVSSDEPSRNTTSGQEQAPPTATPNGPATPAAAPTKPSEPSAPASSEKPAEPSSAAVPPEPPSEDNAGKHNGNGYSYAYGFDDEQRFVIVSGKTDGFTMSGSSEDARHVEKLRKQIPGDFIWFQRDERSYLIRDQATVDRARQLWAPQEELGKKQEELGKQQEALGKQQEELGARMQQVHVKVPDMTAELDKLKAELRRLGPDATMEQLGTIQSEMGELQSRMGEIQSQAGDAQGKVGEEMGALGEQQGKLGEEQGELGRKQAELAQKATKEMKELLDDAIKKGIAHPEPEQSGTGPL